ncbi:MAG TPA: 3-methyl-2-oxobutanoate dehydrogenase subunit VorB [Firmicutes bacterium]|jgi:2-oxoglutarate ferredoxin oxidoreductase subunit alpha|nr:3-methyl-2-oxobutanoate dehydrogenase subunit VorB [Bacillota bacterium]
MGETILMKGNEAVAEAAIRGGCRFFFGYPITPQSEVPEYMSRRLHEVGGVFLQAESEVAAINMVYGASGAGARVMTSSSSPGISLKMEGISYIAAAELPCVIVNMVRGGPGLGTIQPAQSDYFQATKGGGHGDYHLIVFAPQSVQEMVDMTIEAFDVADKYRNPVMILADGLIGQMMEPVVFPDGEDRPNTEKPWATVGMGDRAERNIVTSMDLNAEAMEEINWRIQEKYDKITKEMLRYETLDTEDADLILVAYGSSARIALNAMSKARENGYKVGLVRPQTVWPFPYEVIKDLANQAKAFLTVEMSMGQLIEDVKLAAGETPVYHFGRCGGVIHSPAEVYEKIEEILNGGGAAK